MEGMKNVVRKRKTIGGVKMTRSEADLRRRFRAVFARLGVWSCAYEQGIGSSVGYPDLQLLVHGVLLPVEIKLVQFEDGLAWPSAIRPAQISWHHEFLMAGGRAWIVLCCLVDGNLEAWALPSVHREYTSLWSSGYEASELVPWIAGGELLFDPLDLLPPWGDKAKA